MDNLVLRRLSGLVLVFLLALARAQAGAGPAAPAPPGVEPGGAPTAAAPAAAERPPLDIKEITLENGLRIYVLEKPTSPTFAGYYQFAVGGAMDPKGRSGIAHLLEHMMFKGTKTLGGVDYEKEEKLMARISDLWHRFDAELDKQKDPFGKPDQARIDALRKEIETLTAEDKQHVVQNEYDEVMVRAGGVGMNASTGNDVTRYYIQLPSNRLEFWFRMESDRLLNPVFREFYAERDVVQEERRQRYDTSPGGMMFEAQKALIYDAHPYATPVIGWPADLKRLTVEDAMAYFTTYYSPSNCTMVLAGDVKAAEVEALAKKYFGPWKRQTIPRLGVTADLDQAGERRRVVEFDAEPRISISWPTVAEGDKDQYPLELLGRILGGLESSRLDRTLVQKERIATSVSSVQNSMRWGGYFTVSGTPKAGHTSAEIESGIEAAIAKIRDESVTAAELERAKVRTEVSRVSALKSNMGLAMMIGEAVRVSGGTAYVREYEERINAVTAADVQDVAKRYLGASRKNVIELRKTAGAGKPSRAGDAADKRGGGEEKRGQKHSPGFALAMKEIESAKKLEFRIPAVGKEVERVVLPSGVTVFIKEDHSAPSVEMSFQWLGGSNTTPVAELAPFELAGDLLANGGAGMLDPAALDERKEDLGMTFGLWMGETGSSASFWSLRRNFPAAFEVAADVIMRPRLDPERLTTIKGQYVESMRRRYESPAEGSALIRDEVLDGDHPRLGWVASRLQIESVTPSQIQAIWEKYAGRDNLFVTVVGDFDRKETLKRIDTAFASWRKAQDDKRVWITRDPVVRPGTFVVEKDLPQLSVRFSEQLKLDRTASTEDHAAIEVMNSILGGSGFRSRLMERLRTDEGLTYGVRSVLEHEGRPGVPGMLGISYQTKQESVGRSVEIVMQELNRIVDQDVSEAEVAEQIDAWRNRFVFRFTNDFSIVNRLMSNELNDQPYDKDSRDLAAVQRVTVKDVRRVAQKYLKAANVTLSIYGSPTEADRAALERKLGLKVLKREQVFKGGYDAAPAAAASPAKPQRTADE